ncbi:MAG: tetratricopeptide repeat protein [Acidobacteriota bacterium]
MSNPRPPYEAIAAWTSLGVGVLAVLLYGAWPVLAPSPAPPPTRIVIDADTAESLRRAASLLGAHGRLDDLTRDEARLARVEATVESLLGHHPQLAEGHRLRGLLALARDQNSAALEAFNRCLQLDPPNLPALLALGATHVRLDDPDAAERTFRRAVEYHPESVAALDNWGQALWLVGREDEALEAYRRKLEVQQRSSPAAAGAVTTDPAAPDLAGAPEDSGTDG